MSYFLKYIQKLQTVLKIKQFRNYLQKYKFFMSDLNQALNR
jgi:hypothetical protein